MQLKSSIRITAYLVGGFWSIATALSGLHFSSPTSKLLGFIPLIFGLTFSFWDSVAWHLYPLVLIGRMPDMRGTWLGSLDSEWIDENYAPHNSRQPVSLSIKQSFTGISISLFAEESRSFSLVASISRTDSGVYRINYQYGNKPFMRFRRKMPEHAGSAQLEISGVRSMAVSGEYWTDRFSRGTLDLTWISSTRNSSPKQAQNLATKSTRRGA